MQFSPFRAVIDIAPDYWHNDSEYEEDCNSAPSIWCHYCNSSLTHSCGVRHWGNIGADSAKFTLRQLGTYSSFHTDV